MRLNLYFILTRSEQFGPTGPQQGEMGVALEKVWVDDEWWFKTYMDGHDGIYFLPERFMLWCDQND